VPFPGSTPHGFVEEIASDRQEQNGFVLLLLRATNASSSGPMVQHTPQSFSLLVPALARVWARFSKPDNHRRTKREPKENRR